MPNGQSYDLNLNHNMLLFLFCAHENFGDLSEQIQDVKLDLNSNIFRQFKTLCKSFSCDFGKKVDNTSRIRNIQHINNRQLQHLQNLNYRIEYTPCPDEENNFRRDSKSVQLETHLRKKSPFTTTPFIFNRPFRGPRRSLVLYFRREIPESTDFNWDHTVQMDYFEFSIISFILYEYIYSGYSKVFNDLRIVSRNPYIYPYYIHRLCPRLTYHPYEGKEFIEQTCIGASTIHFQHGTTPDNACGTIPIYCNQMILDDNKANDNYVHLPLNYNMKNDDDQVEINGTFKSIRDAYNEKVLPGDHAIDKIITSLIASIKQLEDSLIEL